MVSQLSEVSRTLITICLFIYFNVDTVKLRTKLWSQIFLNQIFLCAPQETNFPDKKHRWCGCEDDVGGGVLMIFEWETSYKCQVFHNMLSSHDDDRRVQREKWWTFVLRESSGQWLEICWTHCHSNSTISSALQIKWDHFFKACAKYFYHFHSNILQTS